MEESGLDIEGKVYVNWKQMWEEEVGEDVVGNFKNVYKKQEWYYKGVSYWEVWFELFLDYFFFMCVFNVQG